MNFISEDSIEGVTISQRHAPPSHYIFKIQSFSSLMKNHIERYDSGDFESGGYKWKLSLFPYGNKKKSVKDHISLYLVIADTSSLSFGWEVNVSFKLFLLDQIRDHYLTIEESGGRYRRFHGMKTELGFSHLIPHTTLNNPSNGYLVDDTCVFGAEVFVSKSTGIGGECLSMLKEAAKFTYTWNIEKFSQLKEAYNASEPFIVGDYKWHVLLYPKGDAKGKNHVSFYLVLADSSTLAPGLKVYVKNCVRIKNQSSTSTTIEKEANNWFTKSAPSWGWPKTISLDTLNDQTKGFLIKDTCIVEAEVTVLGLVSTLS
ncbi:hypothetical protein Scep_029836 [Stephania cephalantha]|uniref:MATH domain-containing protein n=1 Tax=Stephania cephalantha TaxID=152367 RepID=A0AAP0DYF3_9MAGN